MLLGAIGSYKWGNAVNGGIPLSVANVSHKRITSSVAPQLVIAAHFLFVSCRSIHGCGWLYASLRFDCEEPRESSMLRRSLQHADHHPNVESSSVSSNTPMLKSQSSLATSHKHTESLDLCRIISLVCVALAEVSNVSRFQMPRVSHSPRRGAARCRRFTLQVCDGTAGV